MTFTTIQKTIKIGTSARLTIPAKEYKRLGLKIVDSIKITFEPVHATEDTLVAEYNKFKSHYGETLKNLANR